MWRVEKKVAERTLYNSDYCWNTELFNAYFDMKLDQMLSEPLCAKKNNNSMMTYIRIILNINSSSEKKPQNDITIYKMSRQRDNLSVVLKGHFVDF